MEKDGELRLCDLYGLIRSQINHEDDLVSQRVLWALLPQAFFLGAYVGLLNAPYQPRKNSIFAEEQILLLWLLPMAGLLTGLLAYFGIVSSLKSIAHLRHLYEDRVQAKASGDHSTKFYPEIQGPPHIRKLAFITPAWMPLIFILAWLIVLGSLLVAWF
ncbi:MAG: hypothetical protein EHM80_06110 [Nitrospiraceae bacterium]|nr:MAG: hypothetical protein EHM80_06110 [Nitrospiraceae bacterium]